MQSRKRRYTCEEAVLVTIDQPPLPLRRASVNTKLVRGVHPLTNGATNVAALAVESFRCLGVEGSNFMDDQLTASVVGRIP